MRSFSSNIVLNKIQERYRDISKHPIAKTKKFKALYRYFFFNAIGKYKKELTYKWVNDLRFYARLGDASMAGNIYFGMAEFFESLFCLHFLRNKDTIIDIGANLGHYSLLASGIRNCQSIAVEPVPATFQQLQRQIKLNNLQGKIHPLNLGVAEKEGMLFFSNNLGTMNRVISSPTSNAVEVPVKTVDTIVKDKNAILIKIDVEGYEKFVLSGAGKTLSNEALKVIIMELNGSGKQYGVNDEDTYSGLVHLGFSPYSYDPIRRTLLPLDSYNRNQYNTIFIRDIDFVEKRIKQSDYFNIWNQKF